MERTVEELEKEKEKEKEEKEKRDKEKAIEMAKEKERQKELAKEKAIEMAKEKAKAPPQPEPTPAAAQAGENDEAKESPQGSPLVTPAWPKRPPTDAATGLPKASEEAKSSPKLSMGLPPPGTVSKKAEKAPEEAPLEPAPSDDDADGQLVIGSLDHRYVGLVIGKAGETIKSFKKQSGASIEIDQNLPDTVPRVVIYRGTKKQVAHAKKLVETLVQRAKEDEKQKSAPAPAAPIGAGMGILGRGESKEVKDAAEKPKAEAEKAAAEKPATSDAALPPWRRAPKPEDEPQPAANRPPVDPLRPRVVNRNTPWMKKTEVEAAAAGSLTGAISLTGSASMRPAWMKDSKGADAEETNNTGIDKSVWSEQRYGRGLMLQAMGKILKGKAYEVPEEMMTMTTGARPKYKPDRKEGDEPREELTLLSLRKEAHPEDAGATSLPAAPPPVAEAEAPEAPAKQADGDVPEDWEEVSTKKPSKNGEKEKNRAVRAESTGSISAVPTPYENSPGDSKDIMKLKKKLREIHKIEEQQSTGGKMEPNQVEKVSKKAGYLEELKLLESIVHSSGVTNVT